MKKFTALLLCVILIFSLAAQSFALESQDQLTPAPEITGFTVNADGGLQINFVHSLNEAEQLRRMILELALEECGSTEALLGSPEKYLACETKLYMKISTDGENWEEATEITADNAVISADELSSFSDNGIVFVKILLASENFSDEGTETVYIFRESESAIIFTDGNTAFPAGKPVTFSEPPENDIPLFAAKQTGYIFDGWSADGDKRIGKIPAGTKEITLYAHFIPMQYEINYVLTTDISYPFGRADNSKNPVFYTVGEGARLYDIKSPVSGYSFAGWYLSSDFSGEKITEIGAKETGDRLLYAKWVSDTATEEAKRQEREQFIKDNCFGDPDGDGRSTAADARYVLRAAVGLEAPDTEKLKRVDYFGTGKISSENARITLRIAVGLDSLYDILLENGILP